VSNASGPSSASSISAPLTQTHSHCHPETIR
jgi:hypothetical protein